MAFPPNAFTTHDGRVYSEWEIHKLAAHGFRRFAAVAFVGSLVLLGLEALARGSPDAVEALAPGWVTRVTLGFTALLCGGAFVLGHLRRVEVQRPYSLALLLTLACAAEGSLVAVLTGGFNGPLSFGLIPVLFAWPLLMPGGAVRALLPVGGALVLHFAVLLAVGGTAFTPVGRSLASLLVLGVGASLVAAQVVESWRAKAASASQVDWLSGALSRPYLEERLTMLCSQRSRSLAPISLVMFDLDRFKNLNDTWGRAAGDEVLEMLVSGIKAEIRASDFIGRFGGDEFLLVLDECEGGPALTLLERLRARFASKPMMIGDNQIRVSFAAGLVSMAAGEPLTLKDLLKNAEKALHQSKEGSRNRTAVAPPAPPGAGGVVLQELKEEPQTSPAETAVTTQG